MRKQGYSEASLRFASKALKFLNSRCNLNDPESVKEFIAKYDSASSYKRNLCYAYSHYLKFVGLSWSCPKYYAAYKSSDFFHPVMDQGKGHYDQRGLPGHGFRNTVFMRIEQSQLNAF